MAEERISLITAFWLVGVALMFWGLEVVFDIFVITAPLAFVTGAVSAFVFYVWFKLLGVSYSSKGVGLTMGGTSVISMIPELDIVPAQVVGIIITIFRTRKEDKRRREEAVAKRAQERNAQAQAARAASIEAANTRDALEQEAA